jgi:uncharacterized lipoprotein YbaY
LDNGGGMDPAPAPRQPSNRSPEEAGDAGATDEVKGMATVLVRMAIPPESTLVVELVELAASVKGQPAAEPRRLGEYRFPTKGRGGPFQFAIPYKKADVDQAKLYGVQARIVEGDRVILTTTKPAMVLTNGKDNRTNITLNPAN